MTTPPPVAAKVPRFRVVVPSAPGDENNFDYVQKRTNVKFTGVVGSVAHLVKGALGAGILGGHVAYMKAGVYVAVPMNIIFGLYMGYCLHLLVQSAQILYRRTGIPSMTYPDVGEAAMCCFPNPKISMFAKPFRYSIDALIIIDLYGACACYQLIVAKSLKQLIENTAETTMEGHGGYPSLRVYMLAMMVPIILICLIRHLKYLAPFSLAANIVILLTIAMAVYYAMLLNPTFSNMKPYDEMTSFFEFTGMIIFGMSCAGVVLPVENCMKTPKRFPLTLTIGMSLVVLCTFLVAFFGYVGFVDKSESPITVNFPMTIVPKILKGLIAVMLIITHALNFWVPFNLLFHYIQKCHSQERVVMWEYFYRILFVILITFIAIVFPSINALMGFCGAFCLSNMAFIWPNMINLLVIWHYPGLGRLKWKLWRSLILIIIGCFALVCGTYVNGGALVRVLLQSN